MKEEVRLMKGNEAIAHAAIRYGCDGYFGYPITPQSEVLETLEELMPWETTGMVVLQAESEVAAINMVYGGGEEGPAVLVAKLKAELEDTMLMCGAHSLAEIDRSMVR